MNKKELVSTITTKSNLTLAQVEAVLADAFKIIQTAMQGQNCDDARFWKLWNKRVTKNSIHNISQIARMMF